MPAASSTRGSAAMASREAAGVARHTKKTTQAHAAEYAQLCETEDKPQEKLPEEVAETEAQLEAAKRAAAIEEAAQRHHWVCRVHAGLRTGTLTCLPSCFLLFPKSPDLRNQRHHFRLRRFCVPWNNFVHSFTFPPCGILQTSSVHTVVLGGELGASVDHILEAIQRWG